MFFTAGAVDESSFFSAFEEVPKINIYSAKELDDTMNKIRECIANTNNDWDKRTEAVSFSKSFLLCIITISIVLYCVKS